MHEKNSCTVSGGDMGRGKMNATLENFLKLVKQYRGNSIFFYYAKKFMLVILIPIFFLCLVIFCISYYGINNSAHSAVSGMAQEDASKIDSILNMSTEIINDLVKDSSIDYFSNISEVKNLDRDSYNNVINIQKNLYWRCSANEAIHAVHVYFPRSGYVLSTNNNSYLDGFYEKELVEKILNMQDDFLIMQNTAEKDCVTVSFKYRVKNNIHSVMMVELRFDGVFNLNTSDIERGTVDYKNTAVWKYEKDGAPLEYTKTSDGDFSVFKDTYVSEHISDIGGITVKLEYSLGKNKKFISVIISIMIICILFSLLIPLLISLILSYQYYKIVLNITSHLQGVAAVQAEKNEIDYIDFKIMSLLNKNQQIEEQLVKNISLLKTAQIQALQSQINPHFLFNTLNSVSLYFANKISPDCEGVVMLSILCDMIDDIKDVSKYLTTVKAEMNYVKKYLKLESIKSLDSFDVEWRIDKNTYNIKIIKMVLQPILENVFEHSVKFLPENERVKIIISSALENGILKICISDNGKNMTKERAAEINKNIMSDSYTHKNHIGLKNINTRIKTLYGSDYGAVIEKTDFGTRVTVTFPKE